MDPDAAPTLEGRALPVSTPAYVFSVLVLFLVTAATALLLDRTRAPFVGWHVAQYHLHVSAAALIGGPAALPARHSTTHGDPSWYVAWWQHIDGGGGGTDVSRQLVGASPWYGRTSP